MPQLMRLKGSPKTGGRKKGTPNKLTVGVKDAIAAAADALGGVEALVAWVRANPKNEYAFWTQIYPKLVPLKLQGDQDRPQITRIEHVIVDPSENGPPSDVEIFELGEEQ